MSAPRLLFYERNQPYFEFTNFHLAAITVKGREWSCSETYFQGMKWDHLVLSELVSTLSLSQLAQIEEVVPEAMNPSKWDRDAHMKEVLSARISQHKKLFHQLFEIWSTNEEDFLECCVDRWKMEEDDMGQHLVDDKFPSLALPIAPLPVVLGKLKYPTAKHLYVAKRLEGWKGSDLTRKMTPREAFQLARNPLMQSLYLKTWHEVKTDVMMDALRAKFTQHSELKKLLLGTGNRELVEHTKNDRFWADGGDGSGKNWLGKLLMQLRSEIRGEKSSKKLGADWNEMVVAL